MNKNPANNVKMSVNEEEFPVSDSNPALAPGDNAGKVERRKVMFSAIFSGLLVGIIWLFYFFQWAFKLNLLPLALAPRKISGLWGVFFEPFIHGSLDHLVSNTIPLFFLFMGLIYFYRGLGFFITLWVWLLTGLLVWFLGRPSYHIGASGVVYGLASFHAFSGILRKDSRLISISLLTIFAYGGLIWGIFPFIPGISWESHLMGGLAGLYIAILYRKKGPRPHVYFQDEEDDNSPSGDNDEKEADFLMEDTDSNNKMVVRYHFKAEGEISHEEKGNKQAG